MAGAYQSAHIALARAGALSVSELWTSATPAVFVPFPYATDDHQFQNGQCMAATGAAHVLRQEKASAQELANALMSLVPSTDQFEIYRDLLRESARTQAAKYIAEATVRLVEQRAGAGS
jgi:UDP-N-acetylglucosamine--N-acetylmuramyl-(pentapeptide) pyrophosphoryl-undecaprenol N-acetylglucosamine transferase